MEQVEPTTRSRHQSRRKKKYSKSSILSLLRQYEDEGSTIKSFCQDHDIGRSTFTRWNRIYGHPKKKSAARKKFVPIEIPASSSSVEGMLFAEVGGIKLYQRVEASYLKELKSN